MVVNRKLRIVSEDEVEFQRFRRDTVGVFELKESITQLEKQDVEIKETIKRQQAAAQAAATKTRFVIHMRGAACAPRVCTIPARHWSIHMHVASAPNQPPEEQSRRS